MTRQLLGCTKIKGLECPDLTKLMPKKTPVLPVNARPSLKKPPSLKFLLTQINELFLVKQLSLAEIIAVYNRAGGGHVDDLPLTKIV